MSQHTDAPADHGSSEYDPFEEFNQAQGMGSVRDPYPLFAMMRSQAPVHPIDLQAMGRDPDSLPEGITPIVYVVVSYDGVSEVLRDGKRFSSTGYAATMGPVMGHTILEMDEPEHSRYRGLIQKAFTKKALERWERDLVRPVVEGLIDRFAGRGRADLVRELTFPFPVSVIAGMIGLEKEDHPTFHRLAVELISVSIDRARGLRASQALGELFSRVLEQRRAQPQDDLMSVLAHSELDGTRLTDEEIFAFLRLLAPAGAETTYRSSSNLLYGLLSHPDQLERVQRDRGLLPQAIEEGVRWEPPLLGILRTATCDTEVGRVAIPEGASVNVNLGSANRDEGRWERADEFDISRPARQHMAFAFGAHRCLGMHLARMETSVVLETLFDRLPDLHLDPEAKDVHITGLVFRAPQGLPVRFEPS
jgi:cytochrome P450